MTILRKRFRAFNIDLIIYCVSGFVLWLVNIFYLTIPSLTASMFSCFLAIILWFIVPVFNSNKTIGYRYCQLKIIKIDSGHDAGFFLYVVRTTIAFLASPLFFVSFINEKKLFLHDHITRTMVVDEIKCMNPN